MTNLQMLLRHKTMGPALGLNISSGNIFNYNNGISVKNGLKALLHENIFEF